MRSDSNKVRVHKFKTRRLRIRSAEFFKLDLEYLTYVLLHDSISSVSPEVTMSLIFDTK